MVYYNEHDPFAAEWLRQLTSKGLISGGVIDGRDIQRVKDDDLRGFRRVHLFAGIGGWELALRLAGWPDSEEVWTGSCPCQPFSAAGKQRGCEDERHLWPEMRRLIRECHPPVVFGEQVASKAGREWLAGVRTDLEALGYEVGAADLCAAGSGAPHIRQRIFWVAQSTGLGWGTQGMESVTRRGQCATGSDDLHVVEGVDYPPSARYESKGSGEQEQSQGRERVSGVGCEGVNPWREFHVVGCTDGGFRRIEPESQPLVDGIPKGVGRLRKGYGNAIVPQVAAQFIHAYRECRGLK